MAAGAVIEAETPAQVRESPREPLTRAFLSKVL
jgi:hypothetical protein